MTDYVDAVTAFIAQHPECASRLAFLTAVAEATAVVGLIIPGTMILIGVGAVVGVGYLPMADSHLGDPGPLGSCIFFWRVRPSTNLLSAW